MENKQEKLSSLFKVLEIKKKIFLLKIQNDYEQFLLDSIYINIPKQLFLYLNEELENFLSFLQTGDIQIPCSYAKLASSKGLDENIIFLFFDSIQNFIFDYIDMDRDTIKTILRLSNEYIRHYVIAFQKEKNLKKDLRQEQLYRTVNNIIEVQRQKIITLHKRKMKIAQKEANKRKKFLIDLAHDTMSPLTLIISQIKNYIETRNENDLLLLQTNIHKMIEMIGSFFDHERMKKGLMIYKHSDYFNLSDYLISKINLSLNLFKNRNIKIQTDIQDNIFIKINKHALDRIINNVIDNAVKYNKENGTIKIILRKNKKISLIIEDTGIGMSKEQLNNLFLPYYENTFKPGIRAGLSIIKNILDEISGSINVESIQNTETIVTITFMEANIKDVKKIIIDSNSPIVLFHNPYTKIKERAFVGSRQSVLIIEDDKEFLSLLYEKLSEEFNVFYTHNGKEALELLNSSLIPLPEIIVSDIMMENINGHELYDIIRLIDTFKSIPVIFITAKRDESDKLKSYEKGILDYIQKPFLTDELLMKVKALLYTINLKNQQSYLMMMFNQRDQIMRDRTNDNFLCWYLTCDKYEFNRREREVTRYYLDGFLAKEIAEKLNISLYTIRTHIKHIYSKCKINNRAELNALFKFYDREIKKVLNTDFKNQKAIEEILKKNWRIATHIF